MKNSCTGCGSSNTQKIDVLLATGTQKTVTEETKQAGTILAPITLLAGDVKTGRKSVSVTESDLVKLVRSKLAVLEAADKPLQDAYEKAMAEHKKKETLAAEQAMQAVATPELDRVESYDVKVALAAAGVGALKSLLLTGFSIWGMIVSALIFCVVGFMALQVFVFYGLRFVKPQLAQQLTQQRQDRESAAEAAKKSVRTSEPEPNMPPLKAPKAIGGGFFCHACGEIFVPQEL